MLPSTLLALQSDGHLEKITEVLFSVWKEKRRLLLEQKYENQFNENSDLNRYDFKSYKMRNRRSQTNSRQRKYPRQKHSKNSLNGKLCLNVPVRVVYLDDARSVDSRLSNYSKVSTLQRKEILEDYLHFRDNLKVLFNVIIDEVWKHCHIKAQDLSKSNAQKPKRPSKDSPYGIKGKKPVRRPDSQKAASFVSKPLEKTKRPLSLRQQ
jgi:hypothetical protein